MLCDALVHCLKGTDVLVLAALEEACLAEIRESLLVTRVWHALDSQLLPVRRGTLKYHAKASLASNAHLLEYLPRITRGDELASESVDLWTQKKIVVRHFFQRFRTGR